jgi:large subunit ribosomal protein L15
VGFNSHFPDGPQVINLADLERNFAASAVVSSAELKAAGLIRSLEKPVKVLAKGKLTKALTVKATKFSDTAKAAIEAAGGKAELLPKVRKA